MSFEVNARGLSCPQPVLATKKALEGIENGVITTIVDNLVAKENVVKFATAHKCGVSVEEQGGDYYIKITKGAPLAMGQSESVVNPVGGSVYLITKDTLGHGSDELGGVLMKSFFTTLREVAPLPTAVMFINSGVKLAAKGSPVLDHLKYLGDNKVQILSCGTCLDYFNLKDQLGVGEVTNMYTILTQLQDATKAVTL